MGFGTTKALQATLLAIVFSSQTAHAGQHVFAVKDGKTVLDGRPFLVKGLRVSNALISDSSTEQLIANLGVFQSYGVNTVQRVLHGLAV